MSEIKISRNAWIALACVGALILGLWVYASLRDAPSPETPRDSVAGEATATAGASTEPTASRPSTAPPYATPGTSSANAKPGTTAPPSSGTATTQKPAQDGAALAQITQPPAETVWAFKPDKYADGARLNLVFRPYGMGPASLGESVVVLVSTSTPAVKGQNVPDLVGRNAVLVLGSANVKEGGTYKAVGVITTRGDRSVIVLESAEPTN